MLVAVHSGALQLRTPNEALEKAQRPCNTYARRAAAQRRQLTRCAVAIALAPSALKSPNCRRTFVVHRRAAADAADASTAVDASAHDR